MTANIHSCSFGQGRDNIDFTKHQLKLIQPGGQYNASDRLYQLVTDHLKHKSSETYRITVKEDSTIEFKSGHTFKKLFYNKKNQQWYLSENSQNKQPVPNSQSINDIVNIIRKNIQQAASQQHSPKHNLPPDRADERQNTKKNFNTATHEINYETPRVSQNQTIHSPLSNVKTLNETEAKPQTLERPWAASSKIQANILQEKFEELQQELYEKNSKLQAHDDLRKQLSTATETKQKLELEKQDLQNDIGQLQQKLDEKNSKLQSLEQTRDALQKALSETTEAKQKLEQRKQTLQKSFGELQQTLQQELNKKDSDLQLLKQAQTDLQKALGEATEAKQKLELEKQNLRESFGELQKKEQQARIDFAQANELLATLSQEKKALEGKNHLETDQKNQEFLQKITTLEQQLQEMQQQLATKENDIKNLEDKYEESANICAKLSIQKKELETKIEQQELEASESRQALDELQEQLQEMRASLEQLQNTLKSPTTIQNQEVKPSLITGLNLQNTIEKNVPLEEGGEKYQRELQKQPNQIMEEKESLEQGLQKQSPFISPLLSPLTNNDSDLSAAFAWEMTDPISTEDEGIDSFEDDASSETNYSNNALSKTQPSGTTLFEELQTLNSAVTKIENQNNQELEKQINKLQKYNLKLSEDLKLKQNKLAESEIEISNIQVKQQKSYNAIKTLQTQLDEQLEIIENLNNNQEELSIENRSLKTQLSMQRKQFLTKEPEKPFQEKNKLLLKIEKQKDLIQRLQKKIGEFKEKISSLEQTVKTEPPKNNIFKETPNLQKEITELKSNNDELENQLQTVQKENYTTRNSLKLMEEKLVQLQKENVYLEKTTSGLTKQLEETQKENTGLKTMFELIMRDVSEEMDQTTNQKLRTIIKSHLKKLSA
jgi:chromosome segregation ATPase